MAPSRSPAGTTSGSIRSSERGRANRPRQGTSATAYSASERRGKPAPTVTTRRPPESRSSEAIDCAACTGRRTAGSRAAVGLAESLQLPLRERNDLLLAAGYAPAYPETALADPVLAPVRDALGHILAGHLPYPAIVVDRYGDLVLANDAFDVLAEDVAAELPAPPVNVYRLALHPAGMAPRIANLSQWAYHIIDRLEQESRRNPDDRLAALHAELVGQVPDRVVPADHVGFAVPLRLRSRGGELRLMTTVATFATAVDVTLAELKLEAFLPADRPTAEALRDRPRG